MKIWIATENNNKRKEFVEIFAPYNTEVCTVSDITDFELPPETGETFAENALIKARALYQRIGEPVIADDSGLAVAALGGAPGVYSARYSGVGATDASNRALLLENMQNITTREGEFICVIAFIDAKGNEYTFGGILPGTILEEARGDAGFGYDPIFYSNIYNKSLAELTSDEKNAISHRGLALQELVKHPAFIQQFLTEEV